MKPLFLLLFLLTLACSSSETDSSKSPQDPTFDSSELGSKVNLQFVFQSRFETDGVVSSPFYLPLDDSTYTLPLHIQSDGGVSLVAHEFPRMVMRICLNTSGDDCYPHEDSSITFTGKIDLVMDVCGINNTDKQCGDSDTTVYTGYLTSEGAMRINSISLRIRAFYATSSGDGYTADDADGGLFATTPFPRLVTAVSTDSEVQSGSLKEIGSPLINQTITLVAGGALPDGLGSLSGSHYVASIKGFFDSNPLSLLE